MATTLKDLRKTHNRKSFRSLFKKRKTRADETYSPYTRAPMAQRANKYDEQKKRQKAARKLQRRNRK